MARPTDPWVLQDGNEASLLEQIEFSPPEPDPVAHQGVVIRCTAPRWDNRKEDIERDLLRRAKAEIDEYRKKES